MTDKELNKLKEKLPPKGIKTIAERTGYAYETVRLVLSGFRQNGKIIDAAIALAAEFQEQEKERIEKINAL